MKIKKKKKSLLTLFVVEIEKHKKMDFENQVIINDVTALQSQHISDVTFSCR